MTRLTRKEGHLIVAAIRVLDHQLDRPPTPAEVADMLGESESTIRLRLAKLQEIGSVVLVTSAYEDHVEARDHLALEELPEDAGPEISDDLRDFDRKKQEESRRMARLFDSGDHQREQQDKLSRMDDELRDFRKRKPRNPFSDDDSE